MSVITPAFSGEMQLAGWSESHTGGCKVNVPRVPCKQWEDSYKICSKSAKMNKPITQSKALWVLTNQRRSRIMATVILNAAHLCGKRRITHGA